MPLMTRADTPAAFAEDPIAPHSAQFGLARPIETPVGHSGPSPAGVRPWNLRGAQVLGGGAGTTAWRQVHTGGPTRLWPHVEQAYQGWRGWGEPGWDQFGLTVTPDRHVLWLRDPRNVVADLATQA
jgi:hypothetical protein